MNDYTSISASNLKERRKELGMTQRELAELIGYTEKSISKWEGGQVIAPSVILPEIANCLKCDINSLFTVKSDPEFFLGIDGGGTKTSFLLCDKNSRVIDRLTLGPCNPNDIGMENTLALLKKGITEVCKDIPYTSITMFAGIAGGGLSGDNVQKLHSFFEKFSFYAFDNASDIENIIALCGSKRCIVSIMGTGSITFCVNGKSLHRIAGWGQFFDDGGSAYTIARDAISAVLCDIDKSGEKTALTELIAKQAGQAADEHLAEFYKGGKSYIASFCNTVFKAAKGGDAISKAILEKNMKFVAKTIDTGLNDFENSEDIPIFLSGGLTAQKDVLIPLINKHIQKPNGGINILENDQVEGAIINAKRIYDERKNQNA